MTTSPPVKIQLCQQKTRPAFFGLFNTQSKNNLLTLNQDQTLRSSIDSYIDTLAKNQSYVIHSWVAVENIHTRER